MTPPTDFFATHLTEARVMVILRGLDPDATVALCKRALTGGARLIEVPVQDPSAYPSLSAAITWGAEAGIPVGAGTVTTPEIHDTVARAGAAFTVAPGLDDDVLRESTRTGIPHLPGVATPTEIQRALNTGHAWVKAFPASALGPRWIEAVLAPFPDLRIVATGGITVTNAAEYLTAGAAAVSLGSSFATSTAEHLQALHAPS